MFKIIKRITPDFLTDCIPQRLEQRVPHRLRNGENISKPSARTKILKMSFIYSSIDLWNNLNPLIRN